MSSNKIRKRIAKCKGFLAQVLSCLLLRYTRWNTRVLSQVIKRYGVDRLHVGCGDIFLKDWLNISYEIRQEYGRVKHVEGALYLNYNLLKPWPLESQTVQFIAGSHFIEHLDLNEGIQFLQECYRVLKKEGVIRLSCPDMEIYAKNYVSRNQEFFQNPLIREWCAFKKAETPGEIFVAKAYDSGGSHKWFYDFESLKHILELTGFRMISRCERLEGKIPNLEDIELDKRELETLYVEAVK